MEFFKTSDNFGLVFCNNNFELHFGLTQKIKFEIIKRDSIGIIFSIRFFKFYVTLWDNR